MLVSQSRDSPSLTVGQALWRGLRQDSVLRTAFLICVVLIGYQLTITLLHPAWSKLVTDWLRAVLAWPQLLVVAWVTVRLTRAHRPGATSWWMMTLAMLSYAVARTMWTVADVFIYPHGVPFPTLPDLFFVLQYPCFLAALLLMPNIRPWLPRVRILLDAVLWMSAVTALSWYFVLQHLYLMGGEPELGKLISMGYQIGDLVVFYGLAVALARPIRAMSDRWALYILCLAFVCLFIADTWAAVLLLHPAHIYRTGNPPDLFWFTFYLLVPLASLVSLRLAPTAPPVEPAPTPARVQWRDVLASIQFTLPSLVVVAASAIILIHATLISTDRSSLILPEEVSIGLLILATIRPAVVFLEQQQLRREHEEVRAREAALRLANQRMEEFLTIASHELKTPLTSLVGYIQVMGRRLDALLRSPASLEDYVRGAEMLRQLVERCEHSLRRIGRLIEDLLDTTRIREGRLELRLESRDLAAVVQRAVEEQRLLTPARHIEWVGEARPVPVVVDASRIEQVVMNLLSNALKFSGEGQAVEVRLQTQGKLARVAVHDEGVGLPAQEHAQVWERFHQAAGTKVQSGSQVGLGIGLYIGKTIVEQHHGEVGVESAPGRGTTFWFTLPLAPLPAAE
jgi:signal transduction histidine kinase